jgi:Lrp/AsnC family leucine-responsive transcriptional regulator
MDDIDRRIIGILQEDGRISLTDLSDQVSLSLSATGERMRRLRSRGVIAGFTVLVDSEIVGRPIQALVDVRLPPDNTSSAVDDVLITLPAVVDAVHLTGPFDVQLRVAAEDVAELDRLLAFLKDELGVHETNTRLVLRTMAGFPRPPQV